MMTQVFWQAKIWGLLHDPALKALHNNTGRGGEGCWQALEVMAGWESPKERGSKKILEWIADADLITSASDRSAMGSLNSSFDYGEQGLEISHLLSGAKISHWKLPDQFHQSLMGNDRAEQLKNIEKSLFPDWLKQETDPKKVFWWLWRCLPEKVCQVFDDSMLLMPAETRIPDGSIWNHTSMTAALSGALAGYDLTTQEISDRWSNDKKLSHAYLATFSFTPVQELIKASRKMRDFWAGSWLLHYLSAKVCWELAKIYGPDSFLYPSLFQQPLIDYWLREEWSEFKDLKPPKGEQLLTAGFPNVVVMILPKDRVNAAMQTAQQILKAEWQYLGQEVLTLLQKERHWMPGLQQTDKAWAGWLEAQWQTYWAAMPIGKEGETLKDTEILRNQESDRSPWVNTQNTTYNLSDKKRLFLAKELAFLRATFGPKKPGVNVGSWWPYVFDQTRFALTAVKNARTWQLPTAFGPRSTISGIGPVVHPDNHAGQKDWITEGHTKSLWKNHAGLFDGIEELNATEVVKRSLHRILSKVILSNFPEKWRENSYSPDLTSGVAGWLRQQEQKTDQDDREAQKYIDYFLDTCIDISQSFRWTIQGEDAPANLPWGIPWVRKHHEDWPNPRLLNAGWLIDDYEPNSSLSDEEQRDDRNRELRKVKDKITTYFAEGNNPTDWYVLAAGDGDSMSEWLKGTLLQPYDAYVPKAFVQKVVNSRQEREGVADALTGFLSEKKRMGPATHAALSRALLDFSNQLVPYLTEQRYAGRLIYSGGDDVLAYTNLWEWDSWLWDVRQCFKGSKDPHHEFDHQGDYWRWKREEKGDPPQNVSPRPLFTMGSKATISFGVVIAHHSVPLAIALENLWEAEKEGAKKHQSSDGSKKDAVQVRVMYGNGNILKATSKFDVFNTWCELINFQQKHPEIDSENFSSLFEQAAEVWKQHPAPTFEAIVPWATAFCSRRDALSNNDDLQEDFRNNLVNLLAALWLTSQHNSDQEEMNKQRDREMQNWLKLAAFILRKRDIKIKN